MGGIANLEWIILFGVNALIHIIYDIMANECSIYIHTYMGKLGAHMDAP